MIQTKNQLYIFIIVAITGSLLYFYFDPALSTWFPPCPFYTLTGLYCPGCGSQRAFHHLLHGELWQSADHNLLFVAALPFMGYSALVFSNNLFRKQKMKQRIFYSLPFVYTVLVIVLCFWVVRNLPLRPFNWLAP